MTGKEGDYKPSQERIDERNRVAVGSLVDMYGYLFKNDNSPKKGQPKKASKKQTAKKRRKTVDSMLSR